MSWVDPSRVPYRGLIEDGITEGRAQGERKLLLGLLRQRFGDQVGDRAAGQHRVG